MTNNRDFAVVNNMKNLKFFFKYYNYSSGSNKAMNNVWTQAGEQNEDEKEKGVGA